MTNLRKINILYAPVDNTHQAKNKLKKEKSSVLYSAIYGMQISIYDDPQYANFLMAAILAICELADFRTQPG